VVALQLLAGPLHLAAGQGLHGPLPCHMGLPSLLLGVWTDVSVCGWLEKVRLPVCLNVAGSSGG
jgi:hypothetical protein